MCGMRRPVCLLGASVADQLFPNGGELERIVQIGSESYSVVGVLAAKGKMFGQDQDQIVVVPIGRLARSMGYGGSVDFIIAAPKSPALAEAAREQIEELLRRRRGVRADQENDFGITSQENLLQIYKQVTQGFYLVMVLISSIGLMVGGIGVMNMMLVSVRERTREIGLRMAVGCRRRDLLSQFLDRSVRSDGLGRPDRDRRGPAPCLHRLEDLPGSRGGQPSLDPHRGRRLGLDRSLLRDVPGLARLPPRSGRSPPVRVARFTCKIPSWTGSRSTERASTISRT